ncbi:MAG TPA: ABC transporter permease [Puia sp.]|nr:ABC transporter permease [Puia sp.]
MLSSYINIARRNLLKNKFSSIINIGGLAAGMAVAILIGLWIYDETSYNKNFDNYDRLGKLYQFVKFDKGPKVSYDVMPIPLATELKNKYPDFQAISLSSGNRDEVLAIGDKKLTDKGAYVEPVFTDMFSLNMLRGTRKGLNDPNSILLSQSLAKALFGDRDPMGQQLRIGDKASVKVTGIYKDLPENSNFETYHWLAPWQLYVHVNSFVAADVPAWDNNSYNIFAQLRPGASFTAISAKIKETRMLKDNPPPYHPEFFVFPMSRWHLYGEFKDGVNTGGLIQFVWLFGIIGVFVLLLACINFMNLSTARSERRAHEVGIRKTLGSLRIQLIAQFLTESILIALAAFAGAIALTWLALPFFNELAGKKMVVPWNAPRFWFTGVSFSVLTGLIAGSYPALYLSSFQPVKVLKGVFKAGRLASLPRKVLVVLQFSVSVSLIIGTLVVLRQIQYAKDRSVGYDQNRLIEVRINTPGLMQHLDALETVLLNSAAVANVSASSGPLTEQPGGTTNVSWPGAPMNQHSLVISNVVTPDYGKTVGWSIAQGRDFSKSFGGDSGSVVINEAMLPIIGLKQPLSQLFYWQGKPYHIIGIARNMIRESPFKPVAPAFYVLGPGLNVLQLKLSNLPTEEAIEKCTQIFKKYNPSSPFTYTFVDDQYGKKFLSEERIGKLAGFFAVLAIFISCLGLYGLVSFVAEQRTREIGVRKVLGATVLNVWEMLSGEFMILVFISLFIATPLAYYFTSRWLLNYDYRAPLSWWIFGASGAGALLITLITVSFEAVKAAIANPIKSLRTE